MPELPRVWLARAGGSGQDEEAALRLGLAVVDFHFPSVAGAEDYDAIKRLVLETKPDLKPNAAGKYAGQLGAFALWMEDGDIVVLPRKQTGQIALGKVNGPYEYREIDVGSRHVRPVEWIRTDIPRPTFGQDLLASMGAFLTVCEIKRNGAASRIVAVLEGNPDPGHQLELDVGDNNIDIEAGDPGTPPDLSEFAHDQIIAHIQTKFHGHRLADLVNAVLEADGWVTRVSPPGRDGGVDVFAGRGSLGLDEPRLCVQVKSQTSPCDVGVYRNLVGAMQNFGASQGLLVCWGGFNSAVISEQKQNPFTVGLWGNGQFVKAIYRNYDALPAEIQKDLPLKQVWVLVREESEDRLTS